MSSSKSNAWARIAPPSACLYDFRMRIKVELDEPLWLELRRLASERGERGLSTIVREALDSFLARTRTRRQVTKQALEMRGALRATDADLLERSLTELRASWR
jgi:metal-responsive CopG/Arc/MetJ family transcriptional regulator